MSIKTLTLLSLSLSLARFRPSLYSSSSAYALLGYTNGLQISFFFNSSEAVVIFTPKSHTIKLGISNTNQVSTLAPAPIKRTHVGWRLMEKSTRKKCDGCIYSRRRPFKVRYILIAVVYLLMEETVLTQSTFTSLSLPFARIPPSRPPSHLPHKASKMLFSLHRHWILSRCVFPPWDCRSNSSRTKKYEPDGRLVVHCSGAQNAVAAELCLCVLIFQLWVLETRELHTTPTVAITRGLQKYLQFQYQRRRCIGFPPTWYAREKRKEKGGKSHR